MATLTQEQIEQKQQLLVEKTNQMRAIIDELQEAGVIELSDEQLDGAVGGSKIGDWFKGVGKKIEGACKEATYYGALTIATAKQITDYIKSQQQ